jgi:outer membrane usher protein FimD/PapC
MVSDGGLAWLTGVNPDERLTVHWSGSAQCEVVLPRVICAAAAAAVQTGHSRLRK